MTPRRAHSTPPSPRASRAAPADASEALELLTAAQVGAAFGVRPKHVLALARDGGLPCVRLGKYVRFRRASVAHWLDEREAESNV